MKFIICQLSVKIFPRVVNLEGLEFQMSCIAVTDSYDTYIVAGLFKQKQGVRGYFFVFP